MIKLTKENFILRAREIHGWKYDYSKVEYVNMSTKVCIICPEHGEIFITPQQHLKTYGCQLCGKHNRNNLTRCNTEVFVEKAKQVHGDKYDYSKVVYGNNHNEKVCIICPKHGEFWQTPKNHLHGSKCPYCCCNRNNTIDFIEKAKSIHGDKYDYSKVNYLTNNSDVCITCKKHGEFWQTPANHLNGTGCPECGKDIRYKKIRHTIDDFISQSNIVHNCKYDYSQTEYKGLKYKVKIICPIHGEFHQKAANHLHGNGCPKCKTSKLEKEVMKKLSYAGIEYLYNRNFSWLENLRLDFYLPTLDVAIECQGIQHFEPRDFAGKGAEWANKEFESIKKRDKRKKSLCRKHNTKLIYINNIDEIDKKLKRVYEQRTNKK